MPNSCSCLSCTYACIFFLVISYSPFPSPFDQILFCCLLVSIQRCPSYISLFCLIGCLSMYRFTFTLACLSIYMRSITLPVKQGTITALHILLTSVYLPNFLVALFLTVATLHLFLPSICFSCSFR